METKTQNLITKPPVVVVLGHVDSGKTSILNTIRRLQFTGEKPGGVITQHIGAYQIACPPSPSAQAEGRREKDGKKITFIDTPGHEAFSAMRSRGARVADIAVLVVDVVEGVKEQTKEAISHIKKSQIPLIVALNKIDKPGADPEKVKRELQKENVLVESLGGKIPSVVTSAKTGKGIEELLDLISLVAEMENLKADSAKPAEGTVIESYLDSQRGPTATLIVESGILKLGGVVATPSTLGKIKSLENFQGKAVEKIFPSEPAVVVGFEETPKVGEGFRVFSDLETARDYLQTPEKRSSAPKFGAETEIGQGQKILNLILKADCLGSVEAIEEILKEISQEKIVLRILRAEVGEINESDVKFAKAHPVSGYPALILGFRIKIDRAAKILAEREKIKMITFDVIYDLVEWVRKFMEKIWKPEETRVDLGKVKILAVFLTEKNRQIVGGKVIDGEVKKGASIEIFRKEEPAGKGKLVNLQKNKKEADRVGRGEECGILYEGDTKIEAGDTLIIYIKEKRKEEL